MARIFILTIVLFSSHVFGQDGCTDYVSYHRIKGKKDKSRILEKGKYCDGNKREGDWVEYDQKGRLVRKVSYTNGKRNGLEFYFRYSSDNAQSDIDSVKKFVTSLGLSDEQWKHVGTITKYRNDVMHGFKIGFARGVLNQYVEYNEGVRGHMATYNYLRRNYSEIKLKELDPSISRALRLVPLPTRVSSFKSVGDTIWCSFNGQQLSFWAVEMDGKQYGISYGAYNQSEPKLSVLPDTISTELAKLPNWQKISRYTVKDADGNLKRNVQFNYGNVSQWREYEQKDHFFSKTFDAKGRIMNEYEWYNGAFDGVNIQYAYAGNHQYVSVKAYYTKGKADSSFQYTSDGGLSVRSYENDQRKYRYDGNGKLYSYHEIYPKAEYGSNATKTYLSKDGKLRTDERRKTKTQYGYVSSVQHGFSKLYQVNGDSKEILERTKYRNDKKIWTQRMVDGKWSRKDWSTGFGKQPGITIGYHGCGICLGNPHRCNGIRLSLFDNKTYTKRINGINLVLFRGGKGSVSNTFVNGVSAEILGTQGTVSGNGLLFSALRAGRLGIALPYIALTSNAARKSISFSTLNTLSGLAEFRIGSWRWPRYSISLAPIHFKSSGWNRDFKAALSTGNWKNRNHGRIGHGLAIGLLNIEPLITPAEKIEKKRLKLMEKKLKWVTPDTFN